MKCRYPYCDEEVVNGHHCRAGHVQLRASGIQLDPDHPGFRDSIVGRAERCWICGGFAPCEEHKKLREVELFAWIGEDELGSKEIGIKQALCPAGCIPMVSISKAKMQQGYIKEQLQSMANQFGKTVHLVRFRVAFGEDRIEPGVPTTVHVKEDTDGHQAD